MRPNFAVVVKVGSTRHRAEVHGRNPERHGILWTRNPRVAVRKSLWSVRNSDFKEGLQEIAESLNPKDTATRHANIA
jgi:hypothetical protein